MDDWNTVGLVRALDDLAIGEHENHRAKIGSLLLQSRDFIASEYDSPRNRSDFSFPILVAASIYSENCSSFKLIEAVFFSPLF
jgi:hypothetical protein